MDVAILTVGDEILAGDTENTNATWLANQVTERGGTVGRILVVPDDAALIESTVREWAAEFDAVVVTGGLGGTHDDVTVDAVAGAFDRGLVVDDEVREAVVRRVAEYREQNPDVVEAHDLEIDVDAWASVPAGARPLVNPVGLSPGCVVENVYVFPGVPEEMRALFDLVADEFGGDVVSETLYTDAPEGAMGEVLAEFRERFDVAIGSYPSRQTYNRLKVTGTDADAVARAADWIREHVSVVDPD